MSKVYYLLQHVREMGQAASPWLTSRERDVLSGFQVTKRRVDWRLGRWTAKRALAARLGLEPELGRIEIRAASDGAPEALVDGELSGCVFSLSHSGDIGLCALAEGPLRVGCDIELIAPRTKAFARTFLTPAENELLESVTGDAGPLVATLLWSAKESALKLLRQGLRLDTYSIEVSPELGGGDGAWRELELHSDENETFRGWWRQHEGFVVTIVADPPANPPLAIELRSTLRKTS